MGHPVKRSMRKKPSFLSLLFQMMVSEAQKELLRMCWRSIQKDLESLGVVTFLKVL